MDRVGFNRDLIHESRRFWELTPKTFYHHAVAQYVTKMVAFVVSRKIRGNLYQLLGDPYDQKTFDELDDAALLNVGLNTEQVNTLRLLSSRVDSSQSHVDNLKAIGTIPGVGPWTLKSIQLMLRMEGWKDLTLEEDAYIRKRAAELNGQKSMTPATTRKYITNLQSSDLSPGEISLFLWRIKPTGTKKCLSGTDLLKEDFV